MNREAPGFALLLLLQQHLGDDNPEAEQTNESDCGDNGFHLLDSLDLGYEGILGDRCFAEISQK